MKTVSIITIVAIIVISATSVGVFIGKVNDSQQQPYLIMMVTGLKENYTINEPISFSITLEGYGTGCGDTMATITKENNSNFQSLGWASQPQCVSNPSLHNFKFNSISANTTINQTGNYLLTVTYDDHFEHQKAVEKRFTVMEPNINEDKFNSTECETKFEPKEFQTGTYPNGTSYTVNYIPVFLMKPNSTGKFFVNYWSVDKSFNYSGKTLPGTSEAHNSATSYITMVTYPENISIDNTTNKTIVHTITTYKDTRGFFGISLMFYNCKQLPFAVGYNSTHSFDNDFPWLWDNLPCPFNGMQSQITGISGIDVAYIKKEYH